MITINRIIIAGITTLTLGLSGCMMDDSGYSQPATSTKTTTTQTTSTQHVAKASSDKAPAQATTPGPKRAAAPTLPVIH